MGFTDFLKTIFDSINPNSYSDLSTRSFKDSVEYFLSVLFLSFVVMILLLLPTFMAIPKNIEATMNDFSKLSVNIDLETTKPIELPTKKPYVLIDTTGSHENMSTEKILVTKENVYIKNSICFWFEPACALYSKDARARNTTLSDYSDLKTHSRTISQLTTSVLMFAAPTFIIFLFFLLALKYLIFIFIVALIAFGLAKAMRKDIYFSRVFRAATYASTIMIILDVALMPFKYKLYMAPLIIFLLLMLIGTYFLTEDWTMRADIDALRSQRQEKQEQKPQQVQHKKGSEDEYIDLSKSKLKKIK